MQHYNVLDSKSALLLECFNVSYQKFNARQITTQHFIVAIEKKFDKKDGFPNLLTFYVL